MSDLLDRILRDKRREIAARRSQTLPPPPGPPPPFSSALRAAPMGLIAEVKRRSPSAGVLRDPWDPAALARAYERAGAQAVSVLIDATYFWGGEADFCAVREAIRLPLLYKEFVVDDWQIAHAASLGASAVLLIVAALGPGEMRGLAAAAAARGLECLVEVHDEAELDAALEAGARLVGVNNRNLRTFETTIQTTLRLAPRVPAETLLVSESGIRTAEDVARLRAAGVGAILVGEGLVRRPDADRAVRELMARVWMDGGKKTWT